MRLGARALACIGGTAAVVAALVFVPGGGASRRGPTAARTTGRLAIVVDRGATLSASSRGRAQRTLSHSLPGPAWALSLDFRLAKRSTLVARIGDRAIRLSRRTGTGITVSAAGTTVHIRGPGERAAPGWHHLTAGSEPGFLAVDRRTLPSRMPGGQLRLAAVRGRARIAAFVLSRNDAGALLIHRLAALHGIVPRGRFPLGTGLDGRTRLALGWTTGFWPGSLWLATDLTRSELFRRWALAATIQNLGHERDDTQDLGFIYGDSSVAAYSRLCHKPNRSRLCARLRRSALTAARSLVKLAATNEAAGTIPTRSRTLCRGCRSLAESDTIIDSMMDLSLLFWASRETGNSTYRNVASRHAHAVASLLVRPDGSTIQSVHMLRSTGMVLFTHSHQGLSADSTWSRGQAWALYGFTQTALALRDPGLLQVAERLARYVAAHVPPEGVPPYDYAAPPGAPVDTSAGVVTAAALLRLDGACRSRLAGPCDSDAGTWLPLAKRMLAAALTHVSQSPPLGYFGSQIYGLGGRQTWDDNAEMIFGLYYALDAVELETR